MPSSFSLNDGQHFFKTISLTENLAMNPASSICGFYFWHPEASYFTIGSIGKDQLEDYQKRQKLTEENAKKRLMTILS